MFFSNKLTPAISRTYAGHRQELVPLPSSLLTQSTEFFYQLPNCGHQTHIRRHVLGQGIFLFYDSILSSNFLLTHRQMNTFHWHVVDSQSFPLVIPGFEALSEKGAYNPASVYTLKDVQDIVAYAAAVRLYSSHAHQLLTSFLK